MLVVGVLGLVAAELVARFGFGLGDPPVYLRDPEIEYLYVPSRTYHHLGHEVAINSHSMRSAEFPARKADPRELRVMVIGDSIVAGGGRVDQTTLATERLAALLRTSTQRPVSVGAIASGSWGLPNQLAYVRKFGLFEADVVIIVLNTGDVDDVPGLEAVGAAWPSRTPLLALQEPIQRGIERFMPSLAVSLGWRVPAKPVNFDDRVAQARSALEELVSVARHAGAKIGAVVYLTRPELRTAAPAERALQLEAWLDGVGVPRMSTRDDPARFTDDPSLYLPGDDVHPSAKGHERLAEALRAMSERLLNDATDTGPKTDGSDTRSPAATPAR